MMRDLILIALILNMIGTTIEIHDLQRQHHLTLSQIDKNVSIARSVKYLKTAKDQLISTNLEVISTLQNVKLSNSKCEL